MTYTDSITHKEELFTKLSKETPIEYIDKNKTDIHIVINSLSNIFEIFILSMSNGIKLSLSILQTSRITRDYIKYYISNYMKVRRWIIYTRTKNIKILKSYNIFNVPLDSDWLDIWSKIYNEVIDEHIVELEYEQKTRYINEIIQIQQLVRGFIIRRRYKCINIK